MGKHRTPARSMALIPHTVTLLLRLALNSNLLNNSLRTVMLRRLATPRVRTHNSILIPGMALDMDTYLELVSRTVDLPRRLHDLLILNNNHNPSNSFSSSTILNPSPSLSHNCNLSLSHNLNLSCNLNLSLNRKLFNSNSNIPRRLKLHRLPSLRDKASLEQNNLVHHTYMILMHRTRIRTSRLGPNTMPREAKTRRELFTSSLFPG